MILVSLNEMKGDCFLCSNNTHTQKNCIIQVGPTTPQVQCRAKADRKFHNTKHFMAVAVKLSSNRNDLTLALLFRRKGFILVEQPFWTLQNFSHIALVLLMLSVGYITNYSTFVV